MTIIVVVLGIAMLISVIIAKNASSTTPSTPSTPLTDTTLSTLRTAVERNNLATNLDYVTDNEIQKMNAISKIFDNVTPIATNLNMHPLYILSIAYAETHFGFNLYDPIGKGFGLSQMETASSPTYNTLMITAKHVLQSFSPMYLTSPAFNTLRDIRDNLQKHINNALESLTAIAGFGTKINDDTNPLIDIPANLLLIAGYIDRVRSKYNLNVQNFDADTCYRIAFHYNRGINATGFEEWFVQQASRGGYVWRIAQLLNYTK